MSGVLGPIMGALGGVYGEVYGKDANNDRQVSQQKRLNDLAMDANKNMAMFNQKMQMEMWEKTGPQGMMEQLKKAGLNPALMYGMGGGGGQTTAAAAAQGVNNAQAEGGGGRETQEFSQLGMQLGAQMELLKAQKENIEADTKLKETNANKLAGVDTELGKSQTAVNIAEELIKRYEGAEAKDQYELVKKPNRGVEAKTYQDEMEAKQGVANTIYELWQEGKLKEKGIAEIERIVLDNAKTVEQKNKIIQEIKNLKENLKGVELENVMKELEVKLQQRTGLDKSSNTFLKMIGRLLITTGLDQTD